MLMGKRSVKLLSFMLLAMVLGVTGGFAYYANWYFNHSTMTDQPHTYLIERGSSIKKISYDLHKESIIDHPFIFRKLSTFLLDKNESFKAGEYEFPANITPKEVFNKLLTGDTLLRSVTFPEGFTSWQITERLKATEGLTGEITLPTPEGSLLPNTYYFSKGDSRDQIIQHMKERMNHRANELWQNKQENLPIDSLEEALILASIIEKETSIETERRLVASVFVNRLRKNMRLQTDPTVIYAITNGEEKLDRPLLRQDLKMDSPYNTYKYHGLPPTPICNPGIASIEAALNPETSDYYYFVAKGKEAGHFFAKNLKQHNRNVAKYRQALSQIKQQNNTVN